MAACSDLEIEGRPSEKSRPHSVSVNDAMYHNGELNSFSETTYNNKTEGKSAQLEEQSETGDLNKLSDDEFLHLLEEASTFNKPNNQESVLLKQLRKEVAETDPCENVNRTESACVCEGTSNRHTKHPSSHSTTHQGAGLTRINASSDNSGSLLGQTFETTGRKRQGKCKEEFNIKNNLLLSAAGLGKSGHQFKSLQDLIHPDIPRSVGQNYKKLQKAQRASSFSLSPEDKCNILELESFRTSLTCTKKYESSNFTCDLDTSDHSNSSMKNSSKGDTEGNKNVTNKNSMKACVCMNQLAKPNVCNKDVCPQNESGSHCSILSLQCLPNDAQEIEMKELHSFRVSDGEATSCKAETEDKHSNSKFYLNCTDVDSTVTFPLKLVSSCEEINKPEMATEVVNEKLNQQMSFPVPWNGAVHVRSLLSSLPSDQDSFISKKEKQIFSSDVNGNSFPKTSRPANITSFVSATLLDYQNSNSLLSESQASKLDWQHRKSKRTRNNIDNRNFILAEDIAGHRGKEDIDTLLKYINSSDKKGKPVQKGSNSNQQLANKNVVSHDPEKKKLFGKEMKNCQSKNIINTAKKKSHHCSEEESIPYENKTEFPDFKMIPVDSCELACSHPVKLLENCTFEYIQVASALDMNCNVMAGVSDLSFKMPDDVVTVLPHEQIINDFSHNQSKISSFAADFYSSSEVASQTFEDSGFCVVKKKQRKRYPGKRSESYRWHSAAARAGQSSSEGHEYYAKDKSPHKNSIMLLSSMPLSQRNQCGKQDSRRKSTSSVPHSEHSSADNSDLDSVHSLPVRGSVPHPTQPHPHTTPSSSSSTPQASYADIAKMPVSTFSKLNSLPILGNSAASTLPISAPRLPSSENNSKNLDYCSDSLELESEITLLKNVQEDIPLVNKRDYLLTSVNKDDDSILGAMKSASVKSTRETNTQTDPLMVSHVENSKDSNALQSVSSDISVSELSRSLSNLSKSKNVCNSCLCTYKSSSCSCVKNDEKCIPVAQKNCKVSRRPAVVIMDNCLPSRGACDISFGIDLDEFLEMSSNENSRHTSTFDDATNNCASMPSDVCVSVPDKEQSKKTCSIAELSVNISKNANSGSSDSDNGQQNNFIATGDKSVHNAVLHTKLSSPSDEVLLTSGQMLRFLSTEVDTQTFNYNQIVNFLSSDARKIEEEGKKFQYYTAC